MSLPKSFFVSSAVHERKVKLADGEEHVLHFKELPHSHFKKFFDVERSEDENVRAGSFAKLIAASLCDEKGAPAITVEQATQLKTAVLNSIVECVLDVNGMGRSRGKD